MGDIIGFPDTWVKTLEKIIKSHLVGWETYKNLINYLSEFTQCVTIPEQLTFKFYLYSILGISLNLNIIEII